VTLPPGGTGKIRVFEISKDGKMQKEFTGSEMIGNIPDPVELYAEVSTYLLLTFWFVYLDNRKCPERSWRLMIQTKSLASSISRKSYQERTVCPSSSW
jgi:hypothetical protein